MLYLGPSFALAGHRNAVALVAFGIDRDFHLREADDADAVPLRCAVVPPGAWRALDADGGRMGFLYLDPDDRAWRRVAPGLDRAHGTAGPGIDLDGALAALRALWGAAAPTAADWAALMQALRLPPPAPLDLRVAAAMAAVRADPAAPHDVATHAARAGCAASTFQRRFTAQAGLPWRRWRRWQRIRHAARGVCAGRDLTSCALDAGFASGAHFSDAFRAMFGMPPVRLVDWGVRWRDLDGADGGTPALSGPRSGAAAARP